MKLTQTLITTLTIALIAIVAVQAQDEKPKHRPGGMMEGLLPPMALEKLQLTADQKAKYEEINKEFAKDAKEFWASHAELREKMKAAREAGDKDKMKELMAEMKPMMEARKSGMEKVKALLTDEQKKTMEEMAEKMRAAHGGGHKPAGEKPKE